MKKLPDKSTHSINVMNVESVIDNDNLNYGAARDLKTEHARVIRQSKNSIPFRHKPVKHQELYRVISPWKR
ncbi:MAG: hypothetical protein N3A65_04195 [candidate division WOR-3 bacterium]|nr:hypothetical protein [candidate division WOR-3 bacterium]